MWPTQSREEAPFGRSIRERSLHCDTSLLADVGATHARFALIGAEREFQRVRVLACEDYPSIQDAIGVYLNDELALADLQRVEAAALAVAGPVTEDQVR
jgi:glucokinase